MTDENALGSSLVLYGLQAAQKLPALDDRLAAAKKAITSIETGRLKLTHRLAEEIRRTLKGVTKSAKATPEQLVVANDLKSRVFARSPLRKKNQEPERALDVVHTDNPDSILDDAPSVKNGDSWTLNDYDERIRLSAINREVGDFKSKIRKALDDRAETVGNLVLLLNFVRKFSIRGPMFKQLDEMLIERGAVEEEIFDWGELGHPSTWMDYERDSTGAIVFEDNPDSPRFGRGKIK